MPAVIPIVVGREAAHTPSLLRVFSSIPVATISGGAHCEHKSAALCVRGASRENKRV